MRFHFRAIPGYEAFRKWEGRTLNPRAAHLNRLARHTRSPRADAALGSPIRVTLEEPCRPSRLTLPVGNLGPPALFCFRFSFAASLLVLGSCFLAQLSVLLFSRFLPVFCLRPCWHVSPHSRQRYQVLTCARIDVLPRDDVGANDGTWMHLWMAGRGVAEM